MDFEATTSTAQVLVFVQAVKVHALHILLLATSPFHSPTSLLSTTCSSGLATVCNPSPSPFAPSRTIPLPLILPQDNVKHNTSTSSLNPTLILTISSPKPQTPRPLDHTTKRPQHIPHLHLAKHAPATLYFTRPSLAPRPPPTYLPTYLPAQPHPPHTTTQTLTIPPIRTSYLTPRTPLHPTPPAALASPPSHRLLFSQKTPFTLLATLRSASLRFANSIAIHLGRRRGR